MPTFKVTFPIKAAPKQRAFHYQGKMVLPAKTKKYEAAIANYTYGVMLQQGATKVPANVPVKMTTAIVFQVPKSLSKKEREARLGKPHTFDPDITNLLKSVEDGMQKVLLPNDNVIWRTLGYKVWGEKNEIRVKLSWTEDAGS